MKRKRKAAVKAADKAAAVEASAEGVAVETTAPSRLKIVVYAIARNEGRFADGWVASMSEADEIVVLDTGSTDDTVARLRAHGNVRVEARAFQPWDSVAEYRRLAARGLSPWRFDAARNESMRLIPDDADVCVCTDLDEVFAPGWRALLERAWLDALQRGERPTTASYRYVWNFLPDGSDGRAFTYEKIHAPGACEWSRPCHEVLEYKAGKSVVPVEGMRLEHHADPSKSRKSYLKLLELGAEERPDDDRMAHYLGREYVFNRRWTDALAAFERHLLLPGASWRPERAASMRYMARCYGAMGYPVRQELCLWRAAAEAPEQREALLDLAELVHTRLAGERDPKRRDWRTLVRVCEAMLARKTRSMSYVTEPEAWGARPWDLYAIGLWYSGSREAAVAAGERAAALDPGDKRLAGNVELMRSILAGGGAAGLTVAAVGVRRT